MKQVLFNTISILIILFLATITYLYIISSTNTNKPKPISNITTNSIDKPMTLDKNISISNNTTIDIKNKDYQTDTFKIDIVKNRFVDDPSYKILDDISNTNTKCIKLKKVHIDDDSFKKSKLFDSLIDSCITSKLLKQLLQIISNYYISQGLLTTKPYLLPQDIYDGIVDIEISKGIIEDIIHKETNKTSAKIFMAFVDQINKQLNIRNLETSLEMINRP